jgi:hypothetical protein
MFAWLGRLAHVRRHLKGRGSQGGGPRAPLAVAAEMMQGGALRVSAGRAWHCTEVVVRAGRSGPDMGHGGRAQRRCGLLC